MPNLSPKISTMSLALLYLQSKQDREKLQYWERQPIQEIHLQRVS